ncbi:hypothetical protein D3C72_1908410 [compost metagenome]
MPRPLRGLHPTSLGRSITGITWPRMSAMPRIDGSAPTTVVTGGITRISRTLKTLMPNSSDCPLCSASPSRNSSSSNWLLLVRLVRSSMSLMELLMRRSRAVR